jgi:hypothetical protein
MSLRNVCITTMCSPLFMLLLILYSRFYLQTPPQPTKGTVHTHFYLLMILLPLTIPTSYASPLLTTAQARLSPQETRRNGSHAGDQERKVKKRVGGEGYCPRKVIRCLCLLASMCTCEFIDHSPFHIIFINPNLSIFYVFQSTSVSF